MNTTKTPFEIRQAHQNAAQLADEVRLGLQYLIDGVETCVDGVDFGQRTSEPFTKESTAHAGLGVIDDLSDRLCVSPTAKCGSPHPEQTASLGEVGLIDEDCATLRCRMAVQGRPVNVLSRFCNVLLQDRGRVVSSVGADAPIQLH